MIFSCEMMHANREIFNPELCAHYAGEGINIKTDVNSYTRQTRNSRAIFVIERAQAHSCSLWAYPPLLQTSKAH